MAETPSTVKTAAGSIYRKSDIAKAKVVVQDKTNHRRSPTGEEPKKKQQNNHNGSPMIRRKLRIVDLKGIYC